MRRYTILITLIILVLIIAGCKNNEPKDLSKFEKHLDDTQQKEEKVKDTLDKLDLEQVHKLKGQEMTDDNKKEFNELQTQINKKLVPQMEAYEKSAKTLPAKSKKVKKLKKTYLKGVKEKKKRVTDLQEFVDLCNQSIKANEDILDYTRLFEKKRSLMEDDVEKAKKNGSKEDVESFTRKVENNNKELKDTAQKHVESKSAEEGRKAIKTHIMPLIDKQIKDLNQTTITASSVNEARKNAIEMYYSLQNYYETRQETMNISDKLAGINHKSLLTKGKDLERYDRHFEAELKKLKS
ncbi:EMYY motif lipoprotein [Staphylococcus sp. SQ8-PEA]|uniref:EMYY motif lipoprotein n=1 Tax=Staphylococcus marylandisciuri TaxID=2981529 RepID=A0ABT2QPD3_9STAP|nr:EMYY motif lipoprotein [Staphylococcus marylandisciuri]MCU5745824.1 EMYY motif lipoprotein [Staphylococcus marylandisciuri]